MKHLKKFNEDLMNNIKRNDIRIGDISKCQTLDKNKLTQILDNYANFIDIVEYYLINEYKDEYVNFENFNNIEISQVIDIKNNDLQLYVDYYGESYDIKLDLDKFLDYYNNYKK